MGKLLQHLTDHLYLVGVIFFAAVAFWNIQRIRRQQKLAKKILAKAIENKANEPLSLHPKIDPAKCAGCGACTEVCPEGDIIKLVNHKAVLVSPSRCVGHGECEVACPFGAIDLVFGTKTRGRDIPRLSADYESNVRGLYVCGELGGMGLIRNAVKQGMMAANHGMMNLDRSLKADYDFFVVGSGPAGLSVALAAIAGKASYKCIEQGSFGGTVANFPRQKIVMSYPAELPIVGKMEFKSNRISKENLLAYWQKIRQRTGLKVSEFEKFEGMEVKDGVFHIQTTKGKYTARKLFLAMGVRGSPRRLELPNEDLPKVTYNLLDASEYQKSRVAIVGGGNAGVEAAQQLAKPELGNKVTLIISGPSLERCNEANQKMILALQKMGLVDIWYNANVKQIEPSHLHVDHKGKRIELQNNFLFILIGAEVPQKFLMSLGVSIDKKFGESRGASRVS